MENRETTDKTVKVVKSSEPKIKLEKYFIVLTTTDKDTFLLTVYAEDSTKAETLARTEFTKYAITNLIIIPNAGAIIQGAGTVYTKNLRPEY
jgi:hypothetical protein